MVPSYPTVLLAHQQCRRLVEAVARSPDILMITDLAKKEEDPAKKTLQNYYQARS